MTRNRSVGSLIIVVAVYASCQTSMCLAQAQLPTPDPAQGRAAYADSCSSCHGADLGGTQFGPTLSSATFKSNWGALGVPALEKFISTQMPPGNVGSLSSQAYANLTAYIVAANRLPSVASGSSAESAPKSVPPPTNQEARPRFPMLHDDFYKSVVAARHAQLEQLTPVSEATLTKPSPADWLMWRGNYQAFGYSELRQINKANVSNLRPAWTWSLPAGQNEITPLIHDGVLFVESGNTVQALSAATGDLLWQHVHSMPDMFNNGRNSRTKAMAIFRDMIYVPFPDGRMVALNMKTGDQVWEHAVIAANLVDRHGGAEGDALLMNGGPIIADGKLVIGVSLGQSNGRGGCFVIALDAQTGTELWRFNTIARPGEPGGDSWNGAPLEQRYGAGVWTAGSFDPELKLVYFGTGNTYDTATLLLPKPAERPQNYGLYTDSTLALNVETGKLQWAFQHVHRDVWDLDWAFEQTLVNLPYNGVDRKLVVTSGKIGLFDAVDRATGKYVFSKDMGLQNLVIGVDPKTGRKRINPDAQPEPGKAKLICPAGFGVRNWPATSFDPETQILYAPLMESCMHYTFMPRSADATAAGGSDIRLTTEPRPDSDGNFGRVEAVNLKTGAVQWVHRQRAPLSSSMLATAGGVVFSGARDRFFSSYDATNGALLWRTRVNASPSSSPVTYTANGQQYVAVVAGGGGPFDSGSGSLVAEMDSPSPGVTLWVFALDGAVGKAIDANAGRP